MKKPSTITLNCAVTIGARIRALRKAKKWTQEQLGEYTGLSGNFIGQFERGEETISLNNLINIAQLLDTSLATLTTNCGDSLPFTNEQARNLITAELKNLSTEDLNFIYQLICLILSK